MKRSARSLFTLFWGILCVNAFTFGGGFVIVTVLKRKFVDEMHWLSEEEMLDYVAIAQSAPGSIAVNASILLGLNTLGVPGLIAAVLGAITPPLVILSLITLIYDAFSQNRVVALMLRGMQAGVAAVILDAAASLAVKVFKKKRPIYILMMAAAFAGVFFFKVNVMLVLLCALALGVALALFASKKPKGDTRA